MAELTPEAELDGPPPAPSHTAPALDSQPARRTRPLAAAAKLAIAAAVLIGLAYHTVGLPPLRDWGLLYRLDLDVYRLGGQVLLDGGVLYGGMPRTSSGIQLPFTYPTLAAALFTPLALLPVRAAGLVMTLVSLAALAVALYLVVRRWVAPALRGWAAAGALAASCALEPVTANLDYGQVNIVLLALVAADCLARKPRWPRGALVGLAVAIKLTPAVFLLYFLVRRDLRAIAMSAASFAAFTALGFAAAPAQSARYWTEVLFDSSRIGPQTYPGNQAITGVLARASAPAQTVLWLLASAAVVAACAWIMLRASNAAQPELALAVNALAGLLISPISWSHHWVWLPVAAAALALAGWQLRSPLLAGAAALGLACGYLGPQWRVADARWAGTGWSAVDQLAASSYVWWALAAIAAVALALRPPRHAPTAR